MHSSPVSGFLILAYLIHLLSLLEQYQVLLSDGRPERCPHCGGFKIWKNGTYQGFNWKVFFTFRWFSPLKITLQRYLCSECRKPVYSQEKQDIALFRAKSKVLLKRGVVFSKFGLNLPVRGIQLLLEFVFNLQLSLGYLNTTVQEVGKLSKQILSTINTLHATVQSVVVMAAETFVKIKHRTQSVCLVMDEYGLIRLVQVMKERTSEALSKGVLSVEPECFTPLYYLKDFAKNLVGTGFSKAKEYYDLVHATRIIPRLFEEAIRDATKVSPKQADLTPKPRKAQIKLKRKLLRKRVWPLKTLLLEAFKVEDLQQAQVFIEVGFLELEALPIASVRELTQKLRKFFDKYQAILFEMLENEDVPHTTNHMESTVGIVKTSSKISKSYQSIPTAENDLAGKALYKNFEVKRRGRFKDTSAVDRSGIQLEANDFFQAVGLTL